MKRNKCVRCRKTPCVIFFYLKHLHVFLRESLSWEGCNVEKKRRWQLHVSKSSLLAFCWYLPHYISLHQLVDLGLVSSRPLIAGASLVFVSRRVWFWLNLVNIGIQFCCACIWYFGLKNRIIHNALWCNQSYFFSLGCWCLWCEHTDQIDGRGAMSHTQRKEMYINTNSSINRCIIQINTCFAWKEKRSSGKHGVESVTAHAARRVISPVLWWSSCCR